MARVPEGGVSVTWMARWREADAAVAAGGGDWDGWIEATYEVFRAIEPHLTLQGQPWWRAVRARAEHAPPPIAAAVALLDALDARDGARLAPLVADQLAQADPVLPATFLSLVGLIDLELRGADARERRAYVARHMAERGLGDSDADVAYRVLRAYAARP